MRVGSTSLVALCVVLCISDSSQDSTVPEPKVCNRCFDIWFYANAHGQTPPEAPPRTSKFPDSNSFLTQIERSHNLIQQAKRNLESRWPAENLAEKPSSSTEVLLYHQHNLQPKCLKCWFGQVREKKFALVLL
jgi:hypothetical protein